MLLAQTPVDLNEAVVNPRIIPYQAVRGHQAAKPVSEGFA